jgi:hypothetical protein
MMYSSKVGFTKMATNIGTEYRIKDGGCGGQR